VRNGARSTSLTNRKPSLVPTPLPLRGAAISPSVQRAAQCGSVPVSDMLLHVAAACQKSCRAELARASQLIAGDRFRKDFKERFLEASKAPETDPTQPDPIRNVCGPQRRHFSNCTPICVFRIVYE